MGKVVFLFFLFFSFESFSQVEIKGVVRDVEGKSIVSASVIAKDESNKTLAYTSTSPQGNFELKVALLHMITLHIHAIGYEKKILEIPKDDIDKKEVIQIMLIKKEFEIKEVIIKNELPIKIKKDTVVFDVKAFAQGNEKVVEDLLKKIPGINVLSDGTIKIGDQEVEKIMVEGDDFFEKGYKILTKNMPSNPLDKIEVYKNYSNNKHLNGIENSKKVALNLKLKKESKNIMFGNVDSGYGFFSKNRYDLKSNVMNFGKKSKFYFLTNINNIGNDNSAGIYNLNQSTLDDFNKSNYKSLSPIQSLNFNFLNLDYKRTNFNNQEFFSINDIITLTKKSKLKIVTAFNKDENYSENSINTISYTTNAAFQNIENTFANKNINFFFTKLNFSLDLNKNNTLDYNVKYNLNKANQFVDVYFNNLPIKQTLKDENIILNSELKFTHKINEKNILVYNFSFNDEEFPQNYYTNTNTYQAIIPFSYTSFYQNILQKRNNLNFNLNFLSKRLNESLIKLSFGTILSNEKLISNLSDFQGTNQLSSFANNVNFQTQILFFNFKYNYTHNRFSFASENEFNLLKNSFSNFENTIQSNKTFINPKLDLSYSFNEKNKIYSSHSLNNKNIALKNLQTNYIVSSFKTISNNADLLSYLKNMQHIIGYNYGVFGKKFLVNTMLIYNKDFNYFTNDINVFQNYKTNTNVNLKNKESIMLNVNFEKYLKFISSNLKVFSTVSKSNYQTILNTINYVPVNATNSNFGIELRSGFQGFFNYNLGSNWQKSTSNSLTKNIFSNNVSFLILDFKFFKKLNINVKSENYSLNLNKRDNYTFFDLNADYRISEKLNINFGVNNLFNQNFYITQSISDVEVSTFKYKLVPRFALLKLEYRF